MRCQIYVIDPVLTSRIMLAMVLRRAAYETTLFAGLEDVPTGTTPPAIAIITHPTPEGVSKLRRMFPDTAILAMSPQNSPLRGALIRAGAARIVSTAMDTDLILANLRGMLRQQTAQNELRMRRGTEHALGFQEHAFAFQGPAQLRLVAHHGKGENEWHHKLSSLDVGAVVDTEAQHILGTHEDIDAIILTQGTTIQGALGELIADLRATPRGHAAKIIVAVDEYCPIQEVKALIAGADLALHPEMAADEIAALLAQEVHSKRVLQQLRQFSETSAEAALRDPLTGLFNRRYAMTHLDQIDAKHMGPSCALVLDLDHFKSINDQFGHAMGDQVLARVGASLEKATRASDMVARIGGEEFLILLQNTSLERAKQTADRITKRINALRFSAPRAETFFGTTVSIGIAENLPHNGNSLHDTLKEADSALFLAKSNGRNRYETAQGSLLLSSAI